MPDLGKYSDVVLASYAVSILLIFGVAAASIWRARKVKAVLDKIESKETRRG